MSRFAIRTPYLIVVICLVIVLVWTVCVLRMPVDLFPAMNIPVVAVATFYPGMPPEQIEGNITFHLERFFTLASGIDHMESRSMAGVSLIKVYFQPGSDANADVTQISNLAMADLRRLPQGTLPPVVMKVDASSLPVCLLTVDGEGLSETQLHDYLQFSIRNQIAGVPGATVPPPYGGRYRQIMVDVDPLKLQAHELSPMDVVRAIDQSNLILPAGDVRIGPMDYNIYTNDMVMTGNTFVDATSGQHVFGTYLSTGAFADFKNTLNAGSNRWYDPHTTSAFELPNGAKVSLSAWNSAVGTDYSSTWGPPSTSPAGACAIAAQ